MSDLIQSGSRYTDEDRRAACLTFAVLGNLAKVGQSLGIPATTLYG